MIAVIGLVLLLVVGPVFAKLTAESDRAKCSACAEFCALVMVGSAIVGALMFAGSLAWLVVKFLIAHAP